MQLKQLIKPLEFSDKYSVLSECCSSFIEESGNLPLFKNLPKRYKDIQKVKIRQRKSDRFDKTFNTAFNESFFNLRQRAIFTNGKMTHLRESDSESTESFYIFPIDNFKFMYCTEVENSNEDYQTVFNSIFEQFGDSKGKDLISDLLRFNYTQTNLKEGINRGSEIILYNIPYYYAVRETSVRSYEKLLTSLV